MKICLISPPTITELSEQQVGDDEIKQLIAGNAPLGLLSLAAVLELRGASPHIVDLNHLYSEYVRTVGKEETPDFVNFVVRELKAFPFDVFGFSTICSTYPLTLRLAKEVRRVRPEAKIILGGPQASVVDIQTLKQFPFVDFIVRGEAEDTFPKLLETVTSRNGKLEHVTGLTYHRNGEVFRCLNAPVIADLDVLPLPAFHLYPFIREAHTILLEAGRGCPFACSFCSTNDFFRRRYRLKSPHLLLSQMRLLNQIYGVTSFDLVHDMFTVDRKKVIAFCETLLNASDGFNWSCSARTDCLDDELLTLMAKAGCEGLFLGVDSGSEQIQSQLNKYLDLEEAASIVKAAAQRKFRTTVSLITGFPNEKKEDLRATIKFFGESLHHKDTVVQLHLLAPLAETPITTQYKDQLIYDEIFSDISFQGWEQHFEDRALTMAHRDIFTNFYAVPTRWLDRKYLVEVREFLLHGVSRNRYLMTYLHRDSGDLLKVFDDWKDYGRMRGGEAAGSNRREYYASRAFSEDLISFVSSHYAEHHANYPHLAFTIAKVDEAVAHLSTDVTECQRKGKRRRIGSNGFCVSAVPIFAPGTSLLKVGADYKQLIQSLKKGEKLDRIPSENVQLMLRKSGDAVKVIQLNKITAQLVSLCDGSSSVFEVADSFARRNNLDGIPMVPAGLYGLLKLSRQGLIEFRAAIN